MNKYLAFVSGPEDLESSAKVAFLKGQLLATSSWERAYENGGILVLHERLRQLVPAIHLIANDQGVVLGSLFRRSKDPYNFAPVMHLSDSETHLIVASKGLHLIRHYWGTYVAILYNTLSRECTVLRDPSANLACYHVKWGSVDVFFSDLSDLAAHVPVPLSVNRPYLANHLVYSLTSSRSSAITEIEDLPGGESRTLSNGTERRAVLWHPSQFCGGRGFEDESAAATELRAAVSGAVNALASEHDNLLVLLSGGLDSSIVASCLAQSEVGRTVTCLNFYIQGESVPSSARGAIPGLAKEGVTTLRRVLGSADEREFARKVATRCNFGLVERERVVSDLDLIQLYNAPLVPRPSAYGYNLDVDVTQTDVISCTGATACFTGQGGDTVFYATERPIGALDYAFSHPAGPRVLRELRSGAALSRQSLPHVLGKMIKYGYMRFPLPPTYDPAQRPHLLTEETALSTQGHAFDHPWISTCPPLCPGKRDHVVGIAISGPQYQLTYHSERKAKSIHPLTAQPVVEASLQIPTYILLTGGTSRGLARQAFRELIPREIYRRTVKGTGMAYHQRIVKRNLSAIREHLLDGPLVKEGLLDRVKVESYLTADQAFLTVQATQILEYLVCSTWLTQMSPLRTSTR